MKRAFATVPQEFDINPEFPREKILLLLQYSALGVPTWHTCLVSSRLFSGAIPEEQCKAFTTASFIKWRKFSDAQSSSHAGQSPKFGEVAQL
jgi:hypothetical protein